MAEGVAYEKANKQILGVTSVHVNNLIVDWVLWAVCRGHRYELADHSCLLCSLRLQTQKHSAHYKITRVVFESSMCLNLVDVSKYHKEF